MANIPFSPRLMMFWDMAFTEEGRPVKVVNLEEQKLSICLYPRSYVEKIAGIKNEKKHDFCFRGAMRCDRITKKNRRWVLKFAKKQFSDKSFFQGTDAGSKSRWRRQIGSFDYTHQMKGFVPKEQPRHKRAHFDTDYFRILKQSEFALCPAGDAPWSMRFFEAILAGAIPIVECEEHTGRNDAERGLGYFYYLSDERSFTFDPSIAARNLEIFIRHQTLIS